MMEKKGESKIKTKVESGAKAQRRKGVNRLRRSVAEAMERKRQGFGGQRAQWKKEGVRE